MHWTKYFDQVFLINLPHRHDRLMLSMAELKKHEIQFERFEAIPHMDGRQGLYETMMAVFKLSLKRGYKKILVFEDDVVFLTDPAPVMDKVIEQIPNHWDLLYLGCNPTIPFKKKWSENILRNERSFSTHSVGYSMYSMRRLLLEPVVLPYDVMLADSLQKDGLSFCVNPMLCSQKPGYSNIENRYVKHYADFLENRFAEQIKNIE